MEAQCFGVYDSYFGVDRMINEGLSGGFVDSEYKAIQLEVEEGNLELVLTNFLDLQKSSDQR